MSKGEQWRCCHITVIIDYQYIVYYWPIKGGGLKRHVAAQWFEMNGFFAEKQTYTSFILTNWKRNNTHTYQLDALIWKI